MRRFDRAISEDEAKLILEKGEYGVLSMINTENRPIGIPLNYNYLDGNLYFHCALEGEKLDSILHNPFVSFAVVGNTKILADKFSTEYESVIVSGRARIVTATEKRKALESLLNKYSSDFIESGLEYINRAEEATNVIRLAIDEISGKARR